MLIFTYSKLKIAFGALVFRTLPTNQTTVPIYIVRKYNNANQLHIDMHAEITVNQLLTYMIPILLNRKN